MLDTNAYPALLLNADYSPIRWHPLKLVPWHRALKRTVGRDQKFDVLDFYDRSVRTGTPAKEDRPLVFRLPSVVALRKYERVDRPAAFTRLGIMTRDRYRCAYCGECLPMSHLTFDHVVPRSRGGRTVWTNIVAACMECNLRKGNKSVRDAKMVPMRAPWEPTRQQLNVIGREFPPPAHKLHRTWLKWLGMPEDLEVPDEVVVPLTTEAGGAFPPGMTSSEYWEAELDGA